tara:strand:+ start:6021 stop:6395 length:375 start_codon:yes stop_codon:yes gene_type:complete
MAGYDKVKKFKQALKVVKEKALYLVEEVPVMIGISKSTFYTFYPDGSEELDAIKELLEDNKITIKSEIREKLRNGDKAAELIALYKLLSSNDERKALSMQHVDHTSNGKTINISPIEFTSGKDK